jgi:hypothetical protein
MKKEYRRLAIHRKDATMHEKANTSVEIVEIYFDKKDVVSITRQSQSPFESDKHDLYVTNYINANNLALYTVIFVQFNMNNIILSKEELQYLCED